MTLLEEAGGDKDEKEDGEDGRHHAALAVAAAVGLACWLGVLLCVILGVRLIVSDGAWRFLLA